MERPKRFDKAKVDKKESEVLNAERFYSIVEEIYLQTLDMKETKKQVRAKLGSQFGMKVSEIDEFMKNKRGIFTSVASLNKVKKDEEMVDFK